MGNAGDLYVASLFTKNRRNGDAVKKETCTIISQLKRTERP